MKVLHVIPSLGPKRGGPSMAAQLMATACARAGVSVDVATTNDNERELLDVPIATPVERNGARYFYFHRDMYPYTVSRGLARWVRAKVKDYDVVHIHALFSFSSTVGARAAARSKVPYILRPLGTLAPYGMSQHAMLKRISWNVFERRMITNAAAVHFTSGAERDEAKRLAAFKSEVVPLGIDVAAYDNSERSEGKALRVLFLSRIHPKKQLEMLLRAIAVVPDIVLDVAGSGETAYVQSLKQLTAQLGITHRVRWLGHLEGEQKSNALREAHAFVLASMNENFGIAVVEALASGLPVIVSRGVAIHQEIEAAGAGLIADDEATLATSLASLRDIGARTRMGEQARLLAERSFSIDAMASGLIGMYDRAMGAA
jgi:glycosyltransferase involved in cell wall biosynthesis